MTALGVGLERSGRPCSSCERFLGASRPWCLPGGLGACERPRACRPRDLPWQWLWHRGSPVALLPQSGSAASLSTSQVIQVGGTLSCAHKASIGGEKTQGPPHESHTPQSSPPQPSSCLFKKSQDPFKKQGTPSQDHPNPHCLSVRLRTLQPWWDVGVGGTWGRGATPMPAVCEHHDG